MFKKMISFAAVAGLVFALAPAAQAADIDINDPLVPDGLGLGDTYRLVFVTSTTGNGSTASLSTYDGRVNSAADLSTLPGVADLVWIAIVSSTSGNAIDHTSTTGTGYPIYLLDGTTKVADDYTDLWDGGIDHAINKTENLATFSTDVWTGTATNGYVKSDKGMGSAKPADGKSHQTGNGWVYNHPAHNNGDKLPLYGISPELTIIPEPATMVMLVTGLLGLLLFARRRKR